MSDIINAPSISLRDQIAIRMLPTTAGGTGGMEEAVKRAYAYADAMLVERSKQGNTRYGKKK